MNTQTTGSIVQNDQHGGGPMSAIATTTTLHLLPSVAKQLADELPASSKFIQARNVDRIPAELARFLILVAVPGEDNLDLSPENPFTSSVKPIDIFEITREPEEELPNGDALVLFDDTKVNFSTMEVERRGEPVSLTTLEFKTLKYLVANSRRVISRDELLDRVWGYHNYPTTRTVDNQIAKLRKKLEQSPARPVHLKTVHGAGYKFVP